MTLQDIANLGEITGAIATICTLLYLAIQIRDNTRAMRAEARRSDITSEASAYSSIVDSRDVAELFQNGLVDPSTLDRSDRIRFGFLLAPFITHFQLEFLEHQEGLRDPVFFNRNLSSRLRFLRTPGGRDFWEQQRKSYDPAFEACVDEWLSTQDDNVELRPLASSSGRKGEPERASS